MFSDKNYGLPKDLIEAAKRVHEKQLEEQQVPIVRALKGSPREIPSKASKEDNYKADENEKKAQEKLRTKELDNLSKKLRRVRENRPPLPVRKPKPKNEEVQFTEEELAEAFAIFLEENFHVEMLTEEDLDYVFEEEFPQWLEEKFQSIYNLGKRAVQGISGLFSKGAKKTPSKPSTPPSSTGADKKPDLTAAEKYYKDFEKKAWEKAAAARGHSKPLGPPPSAQRQAVQELPGPPRNPATTGTRTTAAGGTPKSSTTGGPPKSSTTTGTRTTGGNIAIGAGGAAVGAGAVALNQKQTPGKKVSAEPTQTAKRSSGAKKLASTTGKQVRRPAPKIDYKTPVTRRGPDGTYQLTSKGRRYVARKEAEERKRPFSASKFFSQMQQDGN